jgi:hypothetical protein
MPYFVKWTIAGRDEPMEQPISYVELQDALNFACVVLAGNPLDIWVEDENRNPMALDVRIKQHYQKKASRRSVID